MNALDELTESFSRLPGIGKKSAARIANHILKADAFFVNRFAKQIETLQQKIKIFLTRQGEMLVPAYEKCISDELLLPLGEAIEERLKRKDLSAEDCNTAVVYMTSFVEKIPAGLMKRLYALLRQRRNVE